MDRDPVLLTICDELLAALESGCPSLQGVVFDAPFDPEAPDLPFGWLWTFAGELAEDFDANSTVMQRANFLFTGAFEFSAGDNSCRRRGVRLHAEVNSALMKDPGRGRNTEANCPRAFQTYPKRWLVNPVASGRDVGMLDFFFDVEFSTKRADFTRQ